MSQDSSQHETGVSCPHCAGMIVAEVKSVSDTPRELIPIGPGTWRYYYNMVTSFHCSECQTEFRHPPGKPDAEKEILASIPREGGEGC
jgi:DNA-directed RNA polymerase subunit RPC12/RpoP